MQSSQKESQLILIDSVIAKGETGVITGNKELSETIMPLVGLFVSTAHGKKWVGFDARESKVLMVEPAEVKVQGKGIGKAIKEAGGKIKYKERMIMPVVAGDWEKALSQITDAAVGYDVVLVVKGEWIWGWGWEATVCALDEIRNHSGAAVIGEIFGSEEERNLFGAKEADVCIEITSDRQKPALKIDRRGAKTLSVRL